MLKLFSWGLLIGLFVSCSSVINTTEPTPSTQPTKYQKQQIERKYGMFIHFGINTFHDLEWTDGFKPASSYAPITIDAEQWILTAKNAGVVMFFLFFSFSNSYVITFYRFNILL